MEPHGGANGTGVDDLTIRVRKADEYLMFDRARNVGLGDSSCIFEITGPRKGQIMRRGEYLFAIDDKGKIVNRVNWPRNSKDLRTIDEIYGYLALWKYHFAPNNKICTKEPIWHMVKHLVWVTVEAWHTEDVNNPWNRFGELRERSISVTVYNEPDKGFGEVNNRANPFKHLHLDNSIIERGINKGDSDIIAIRKRLYELCVMFQDGVYFDGMQAVLDHSNSRTASGQFGTVKVLCAEINGDHIVTLEDDEAHITFCRREGCGYMNVLGQEGTLPQIDKLVGTVIHLWSSSRESFGPDDPIWVM